MATLTTPKYALPYPDGTERVADGDNAMGALALATEAALAKAVTRALRLERKDVIQGTATGANERLTFTSVQRDDAAGFLTYTAMPGPAGDVTVVQAGWVMVTAGCNWPANATGHRQLWIQSGAAQKAGIREPAPSTGGMPQNVAAMFWVPAGTIVAAYVSQNSGGGSNLVADERQFLSILYLG